MRAALRAVVTFALVLTVPMQGFAACFLLLSDLGTRTSTALSEPVESLASATLTDSHESPAGLEHDRTQDAKPKKFGVAKHEARSGACCFAAIAVTLSTVDVAPLRSAYARVDLTPPGGLTPEVLERPPRRILA